MIRKFVKGNDRPVDVACGNGHSIVTTQSNKLYSWGEGN